MYIFDLNRYNNMLYLCCGKSGLKFFVIFFGFWYNFGYNDLFDNMWRIVLRVFDFGIIYFDLVNNYGFLLGVVEENFGRIFKFDLKFYRD